MLCSWQTKNHYFALGEDKLISGKKNKKYSQAEFQEIRQKTTLPPVLNFTGI